MAHVAPKGGLYVLGMKVANEGDEVSDAYAKALIENDPSMKDALNSTTPKPPAPKDK